MLRACYWRQMLLQPAELCSAGCAPHSDTGYRFADKQPTPPPLHFSSCHQTAMSSSFTPSYLPLTLLSQAPFFLDLLSFSIPCFTLFQLLIFVVTLSMVSTLPLVNVFSYSLFISFCPHFFICDHALSAAHINPIDFFCVFLSLKF